MNGKGQRGIKRMTAEATGHIRATTQIQAMTREACVMIGRGKRYRRMPDKILRMNSKGRHGIERMATEATGHIPAAAQIRAMTRQASTMIRRGKRCRRMRAKPCRRMDTGVGWGLGIAAGAAIQQQGRGQQKHKAELSSSSAQTKLMPFG
jgi:hypothetical protein